MLLFVRLRERQKLGPNKVGRVAVFPVLWHKDITRKTTCSHMSSHVLLSLYAHYTFAFMLYRLWQFSRKPEHHTCQEGEASIRSFLLSLSSWRVGERRKCFVACMIIYHEVCSLNAVCHLLTNVAIVDACYRFLIASRHF
jgi:hypothetical protein